MSDWLNVHVDGGELHPFHPLHLFLHYHSSITRSLSQESGSAHLLKDNIKTYTF